MTSQQHPVPAPSRIRPHLALAIVKAECVLVGFNGGVCDLATHIPDTVQRAIFDYMFERGERFSIPQMLSDLGPMMDLAVERGYADVASTLVNDAEHQAIEGTSLTPGIAELLKACHDTGRRVAVVGSNATEVVEELLTRHGLRNRVDVVMGREAMEPPSLLDAVNRLGSRAGNAMLVSDRVEALMWAKDEGLLRLGFEGHDNRKHLSDYGPVVTNLRRLAQAMQECGPFNPEQEPGPEHAH